MRKQRWQRIIPPTQTGKSAALELCGIRVQFVIFAWGRMVSKYQAGDYLADYAYRYGSRLYSVTSTFPGEGTVTYGYGGDGLRRARTAGAEETWYEWSGWTVISEEDEDDGTGNLTRTYVGRLAQHEGSDPSSGGTWRYTFLDHLGSTRQLLDSGKNTVATYEHSPYGQVYSHTGETATRLFTGHDWDATASLYYAPFRYYSPASARWITRDPLGMVDGPNVYAYVRGNPVNADDWLGLSARCVHKTGCFCPWNYNDTKFRDTTGQVWCCHYIKPDKCEKCFNKYRDCMIKAGNVHPKQERCKVKLVGCVDKYC